MKTKNPATKDASLVKVRLNSSEMVGAPGLIAWAINGYAFKRDQKKLREVVGETWNLKDSVVHDLLSKKIPHQVVGSVVEFETEDLNYKRVA